MNILIVDDNSAIRESLSELIRDLGHFPESAESSAAATKLLETEKFQMVICDIHMPGKTGLELLSEIKTRTDIQSNIDFVMLTGFGSKESVLQALRAGAYDYLEKPVDVNLLLKIIKNIEERHLLLAENQEYAINIKRTADEIAQQYEKELNTLKDEVALAGIGALGVFGEGSKDIYKLCLKYHEARDIPVLIQGETGTGKEVAARLIHYGGQETKEPFVDINCSTLSPSLFEAELFGYEPGAFTGASSKGGKGKLEAAAGGTLFLDEISEMPFDQQAKLLRVLQEKEFYRVGGSKKVPADVRIICAANKNLERMVNEGSFRQDLYYRLNLGIITMPPLRERKEEILPLAQFFLEIFATKRNKHFKTVGNDAAEVLLGYDWPGNVRQLKNAIEWSVFMHDGAELREEHLNIRSVDHIKGKFKLGFDKYELPADSFPLKKHVNEIIENALALNGGNKLLTAKYLGVSRTVIYNLEKQKDLL